MPFFALLTDFGTDDPFVGIMKAVIHGRAPGATIVDLTHAIAPQSVSEGAFWLEHSIEWLPPGAIVVAVVDPGVGTSRAPVVVEALGRLFVGPDNGLLSGVALRDPSSRAYVIEPSRLGLAVPSRTFHGRDVFAPVAAELATHRVPADVGPLLAALLPPALPRAVRGFDTVQGVVVTVDHFGNLITNVDRVLLPSGPAVVEAAWVRTPLRDTYGDVQSGDVVALVNAFEVVELAIRDGNAAASLGLGKGVSVTVRRAAPGPSSAGAGVPRGGPSS